MDFWQRARSLAEEAARRSQEITSVISVPSKLSDVVSEASKRSMEIATEASRRSKEIASEALKRADQIKSQLPPAGAAFSSFIDSNIPSTAAPEVSNADLEMFGVTDDLREFVKGITSNTFHDFPLEDDSEISDVPAVLNVRQDLTEWQEKHAKFVLATVKEIKRLRYELCPRAMKERKFWRIYFIIVSSFVDQYEKRYMEEQKLKALERKDSEENETKAGGIRPGDDEVKTNQKSKNATSEQDLDVFLLGDAGDSDDGPDDGENGDDGFDDDFDKI